MPVTTVTACRVPKSVPMDMERKPQLQKLSSGWRRKSRAGKIKKMAIPPIHRHSAIKKGANPAPLWRTGFCRTDSTSATPLAASETFLACVWSTVGTCSAPSRNPSFRLEAPVVNWSIPPANCFPPSAAFPAPAVRESNPPLRALTPVRSCAEFLSRVAAPAESFCIPCCACSNPLARANVPSRKVGFCCPLFVFVVRAVCLLSSFTPWSAAFNLCFNSCGSTWESLSAMVSRP